MEEGVLAEIRDGKRKHLDLSFKELSEHDADQLATLLQGPPEELPVI